MNYSLSLPSGQTVEFKIPSTSDYFGFRANYVPWPGATLEDFLLGCCLVKIGDKEAPALQQPQFILGLVEDLKDYQVLMAFFKFLINPSEDDFQKAQASLNIIHPNHYDGSGVVQQLPVEVPTPA